MCAIKSFDSKCTCRFYFPSRISFIQNRVCVQVIGDRADLETADCCLFYSKVEELSVVSLEFDRALLRKNLIVPG